MDEEGASCEDSGAKCAGTGLAPPCFAATELFHDDFLKAPNISFLQRVHRLHLSKRCRTTESVLAEVEEKGTLVERVSELEGKLIQLRRMMSIKRRDDDVEKHEVTTVSNAPLEHSQQDKAFVDAENIGMGLRIEQESPLHKPIVHETGSSEETSMEEDDARAHQHQYKEKSEKVRRWITKRLHIGSTIGGQAEAH